jgi:ribonuclease HI
MRESETGLLNRFKRELSRSNDPPYLSDPLYNLAMGWLREGPHPDVVECQYIFCDGGQTAKNGSPGTYGSYGVCVMYHFPEAEPVDFSILKPVTGGVVSPDVFGLGWDQVTNNLAEMCALIRALCWLPEGWDGFLVCDSEITMRRWENLGSYVANSEGNLKELFTLWMMIGERTPNIHPLYWPGHGKGTDHLTAGNELADALATAAAMNYREFMRQLDLSVEKGLEYMALEEAFNGGF